MQAALAVYKHAAQQTQNILKYFEKASNKLRKNICNRYQNNVFQIFILVKNISLKCFMTKENNVY